MIAGMMQHECMIAGEVQCLSAGGRCCKWQQWQILLSRNVFSMCSGVIAAGEMLWLQCS